MKTEVAAMHHGSTQWQTPLLHCGKKFGWKELV